MVKLIPTKKKACGSKAKITLPTIISRPPQNKDLRKPRILSANNPPTKVKAYTQAWVAPYCNCDVTSSIPNLETINTTNMPRMP